MPTQPPPKPKPDKAAPARARRRLKIGYMTQHAYHGIGMQLMTGVYQAAQDFDINLIALVGGSTLTNRVANQAEITAIRLLNENSIDGLISWASSFRYYINIGQLELFHHHFHLPVISISIPIAGIPSILVDNYLGIEQLMTHLIKDHGRSKLAFIRANEGLFYSDQRFEAYRDVLAKYQIPYDENLVVTTSDIKPNEAVRAIRVLLDERGLIPGRDFETIISMSDIFSATAIEELKRRGYHIPGDLTVAGFNNRPESYTVSPSLTTVEPNFYQHGYQAVKTLREMMEGKNVPERIYIPTSLIIRQSCGCLEETVIRADSSRAGAQPQGLAPIEPSSIIGIWLKELAAKRDSILATFQPWADLFPMLEPAIFEKLFDCFLDHFQTGSPGFFYLLEEYLFQSKSISFKLTAWEDYLSELRRLVLPYLTDGEAMRRVEDFFHQARVMVFKALENATVVAGQSPMADFNVLAQLGGVFVTTLDVAELMNTIAHELPKIGIPGCYLALYENPAQPADGARLILAFNEKGRIDLKDGVVYPTSQLLPEEFFPQDKRYSLLVNTCYHQDHQLGMVIFEMGPLSGVLYEILRDSFSSALYGALIMKERLQAEADRERLLEALEAKNHQLEERNQYIKKVNEQLQAAIHEANRANAAKSIFLTNMSHEIRTPLNCILGFAEVAKGIANPDQQQYYLNLIGDESEKLLALTNQLLDISKIEAGKVKIQNEPFNLFQVMESLTSVFSTSAKNKGLYYEFEAGEGFPEYVSGDALRFRQILVNLISNAIKFTHQGGIKVSAEVERETAQEILLRFQIRDTGIGIPRDRQQDIFETFVQAESSTTRKYGGTGLGTAIAKQLTELMGGKIGVNSEVGAGSTFWFTVCLEKAAPPDKFELVNGRPAQEAFVLPEIKQKIKILLVEDYATNQKVVLAHLAGVPCEVSLAENGKQAVDLFQGHKYDIILMDIQMPEMDGYEATRIIRSRPGGDRVPIVALTAVAFESDIQRCLGEGMNDVIIKPFHRDQLIEKIIYWSTIKQRGNLMEGPVGQDIVQAETSKSMAAIDFQKVLSDFNNDREMALSVIDEYILLVRLQIEKMVRAIEAEDCEKVSKEAHSLKGGALILAANGLAKAALQLELAGKSKELSACSIGLTRLREELNRLESFIHRLKPGETI